MNNRLLTGVLATALISAVAGPAHAQSHQMLQRARARQYSPQPATVVTVPNKREVVQFYHAPLRLQVVDERPILTDTRVGPEAPVSFDIPIAPLGDGGAVRGGSAGPNLAGGIPIPGGGPGFRDTLPMVAGMRALPKSGFATNIPTRGMLPQRGLPNGNSTNMLAGKMMPRERVAQGDAGQRGRLLTATPAAPVVAVYNQPVGSAVVSGGMHTSTSVIGKIKSRGELLSRK